MKLTLTSLLTFLAFTSFGQKIKYLNENFIQVNFKDQATFYTETFQDGPQAGTVKTYNMQGSLLSEETFSNIKRQTRHGLSRQYYPDGRLKMETTFNNGVIDGPLRTFYPTQRLRRAELYEKGNLLQSKCLSKAGYDTTYYAFQTEPQFPGGGKALDNYLVKNCRYPMVPVNDELIRKGFVSFAIVKFAVSTTGKISDIMIHRSLGTLYDREIIRLMNQMPAWEPCKQDGENIASEHVLTLGFR